jgi:hypothetical protein
MRNVCKLAGWLQFAAFAEIVHAGTGEVQQSCQSALQQSPLVTSGTAVPVPA